MRWQAPMLALGRVRVFAASVLKEPRSTKSPLKRYGLVGEGFPLILKMLSRS